MTAPQSEVIFLERETVVRSAPREIVTYDRPAQPQCWVVGRAVARLSGGSWTAKRPGNDGGAAAVPEPEVYVGSHACILYR